MIPDSPQELSVNEDTAGKGIFVNGETIRLKNKKIK